MPAAKSSRKPRPGQGMVTGGRLRDYNPMKVNPLREQFAPTSAQPIRQRARMAGDPTGDEEPTPGQLMIKKVQDVNKKPASMTDRELEGAKGANDPKSEAGKERMRRLNSEVR